MNRVSRYTLCSASAVKSISLMARSTASEISNCSVAVRGESDHLVVPQPAAIAKMPIETRNQRNRIMRSFVAPIQSDPKTQARTVGVPLGVAEYNERPRTDKPLFMSSVG